MRRTARPDRDRKRARSTAGLLIVGLLALTPVVGAGPAAGDGNEAPGNPGLFQAISAGNEHTCAILATGTVKCWGKNEDGQLGVGDTEARGDEPFEAPNLPAVDLGAGRTATAISAGRRHTCAVLDDGSVKCWGWNFHGQLGLGDNFTRGDGAGEMGDSLPAVDLGTERTAVAVSAGGTHTCVLLDDATVKCWGLNSSGELGLGDNFTRGDGAGEMGDSLPAVDVGDGRTATAITAGVASHTCAILDDATLKCWGLGVSGQLGPNLPREFVGDEPAEMGEALPAVNIGAGRAASAVTAGDRFTCVLRDDGTVQCWGESGPKLGLGDGSGPVDLGTGRTAVAVSSGGFHACALLDDATVKCWGFNAHGQLGQGDDVSRGSLAADMGDNLLAVDLGTGGDPDLVTTGGRHTCAHLDDATLKCWGRNNAGQLGLGDTDDRGDAAGEMGDDLPPVDVTGIPSMTVTKSADQTQVFTGDPIDYHITITNTGDTTLRGITVEDPAVPSCEGPVADLGPAASVTVDCAHLTQPGDAGTFSNVATVDSDVTDPVTSNQVDVTVVRDRRPDAALKKAGGTRVGDELYGTDPTNPDQTVTVGRRRGGRVTFVAHIRNDGDRASRYELRRIGTDAGLRVRYFQGPTDITRAVVDRTYRTPLLQPGASTRVRAEVTVTATALRRDPHFVTLRARSLGDLPQVDTVRGVVLVN